ncbi:hypothetical protein C8J56DRAFT_1159912 [Mycena floridula]|nr:hypothetical protein C8J56DRAFT_1159912 [Mycena floridula]
MSQPTQSGPLVESDIYTLKGMVITGAVNFLVLGIYMTVVIIALYILCTKKTRLAARNFLIAATIIVFLCSTTTVVSNLAIYILQIAQLGTNPPDYKDLNLAMDIYDNILLRLTFLISDTIVVWRAWVLWPNRRVRALLAFCWLGSLGGAITDDAFGMLWVLKGDTRFTPTGPKTLILSLPLLITNIVSTSLVGYKVWQYRTQIKAHLSVYDNKKTQIEKILVLLTESGVIYCLLWIFIAVFAADDSNKGTIMYVIWVNMTPQLAAIYPVIIVLLVSLDKTQLETTLTLTNVSHSIQFTNRKPRCTSRSDVESRLTNTHPVTLDAEESHELDSLPGIEKDSWKGDSTLAHAV